MLLYWKSKQPEFAITFSTPENHSTPSSFDPLEESGTLSCCAFANTPSAEERGILLGPTRILTLSGATTNESRERSAKIDAFTPSRPSERTCTDVMVRADSETLTFCAWAV